MNLARGAGTLGQKPSFQKFLSELMGRAVHSERDAAIAVREFCKVVSRAELNTNDVAGNRYIELIRRFNGWMNKQPLNMELPK